MSGLAVVTAARRYRALLAIPGVVRVAVPSLIGRLPYGMATLLFVLAVEHGTGSYAIAGLATAAHSAVTATTAPWLGRLADRGHAVRVLTVTGVGYALALSGMVAALWLHTPAYVIIGLAGLAGALNPPVGAVTRVVLPGIAPAHAQTAYALDAITVELTFVVGPALIAAISALLNPYYAVILTALLAATGALSLASAPGLADRYRATARANAAAIAGGTDDRTRLLRLSMLVVLLVGGLESAAYGVMEVAIPAYADALGSPGAAGAVVAAWSAGSIAGGIWFSGLNPKLSLPKLFALLMGLNMIGFAAMLLATGLASLGLLLFVGGMVIAPTTAVTCALVTALAPLGRATEAFTWTGTGIYVGFASGSALSGLAISAGLGMSVIIMIATSMVALGATLALLARARITRDAAATAAVLASR
jgi:MFS family permease